MTDASGRFALVDLDEGEVILWSLDVSLPAGSPYGRVENHIVVSSGTGVTEVAIVLLRR